MRERAVRVQKALRLLQQAAGVLPPGLRSGMQGICGPVLSGRLDQAGALLHAVAEPLREPPERLLRGGDAAALPDDGGDALVQGRVHLRQRRQRLHAAEQVRAAVFPVPVRAGRPGAPVQLPPLVQQGEDGIVRVEHALQIFASPFDPVPDFGRGVEMRPVAVLLRGEPVRLGPEPLRGLAPAEVVVPALAGSAGEAGPRGGFGREPLMQPVQGRALLARRLIRLRRAARFVRDAVQYAGRPAEFGKRLHRRRASVDIVRDRVPPPRLLLQRPPGRKRRPDRLARRDGQGNGCRRGDLLAHRLQRRCGHARTVLQRLDEVLAVVGQHHRPVARPADPDIEPRPVHRQAMARLQHDDRIVMGPALRRMQGRTPGMVDMAQLRVLPAQRQGASRSSVSSVTNR